MLRAASTDPANSREADENERARRLVLEHGWNATSYQVLNPGIRLWFATAADGVIGYVRHGRTRVVAGAPVCAQQRLGAIAAEFEADAAASRERVCYFAAESRLESLSRHRGYARLWLGAQPMWRPERLVATIAGHASLRAQLHRARNKGIAVAEWPIARAQDPALRRCLREWLATRGLPALHFLVEPQTLDRLFDRRIFVAERAGRPIAFLVATPIPARSGWLVEQIVRSNDACNGSSELLLDAAARAITIAGANVLTLGLAPLATRAGPCDSTHPWWIRGLFSWLRAHGRRFYDFHGLEAFKAKFQPDAWEPVFALATAPRIGPSTLRAIAGAFARGSPELLVARGLLRAVASEARRAARWVAGTTRGSAAP